MKYKCEICGADYDFGNGGRVDLTTQQNRGYFNFDKRSYKTCSVCVGMVGAYIEQMKRKSQKGE